MIHKNIKILTAGRLVDAAILLLRADGIATGERRRGEGRVPVRPAPDQRRELGYVVAGPRARRRLTSGLQGLVQHRGSRTAGGRLLVGRLALLTSYGGTRAAAVLAQGRRRRECVQRTGETVND